MKIVTISITEFQDECIQKIINLGFFPSRSSAVRFFIHEGINETIKLVEKVKAGVLVYDRYYSKRFYDLINGRITKRPFLPKLLNGGKM